MQTQDPRPTEPVKPGALRLRVLPRVLARIAAGLALVWMLALVAWPERQTVTRVVRMRCGNMVTPPPAPPAGRIWSFDGLLRQGRLPRSLVYRDDSFGVLIDGLFG